MLIDLEKARDTDPLLPGVTTVLHADEWTTITAEAARFTITWLNKAARIAVVHVVLSETYFIYVHPRGPHKKAWHGKALAGPDGGIWLNNPGFGTQMQPASTAALQLAADRVREALI
jgi:hypothetical protein